MPGMLGVLGEGAGGFEPLAPPQELFEREHRRAQDEAAGREEGHDAMPRAPGGRLGMRDLSHTGSSAVSAASRARPMPAIPFSSPRSWRQPGVPVASGSHAEKPATPSAGFWNRNVCSYQ